MVEMFRGDLTDIKDEKVKYSVGKSLKDLKNLEENLIEKNTAENSETMEGVTEKKSTIVDKLKAMFGSSVKSDLKIQCSKTTLKTNKQSNNCIKLMSMRKLKHFIVKESESDGELYRRRQMKQDRHQHFLLKNLRDKELFKNRAKTLGHLNHTQYSNNTRKNVKISKEDTKTQSPKKGDEDGFLKCTEYFIQHLKTSRPNFIQLTNSSVMKQLMSRGTTVDTKTATITSDTYKRHLDTRKSGTRKIMDTIDEKIHQLNLTLKEKFMQDKRNMVKGSLDEIKNSQEDAVTKPEIEGPRAPYRLASRSSNVSNEPKITAGKVLQTPKSSNDLNLDQVFANKNNWITLNMQDEMRIRSDIGQLLTQ
ncbi:hypothetical protein WDU94_013170 [Cyamophila willieti]